MGLHDSFKNNIERWGIHAFNIEMRWWELLVVFMSPPLIGRWLNTHIFHSPFIFIAWFWSMESLIGSGLELVMWRFSHRLQRGLRMFFFNLRLKELHFLYWSTLFSQLEQNVSLKLWSRLLLLLLSSSVRGPAVLTRLHLPCSFLLGRAVFALSDVRYALRDPGHQAVQGLGQADLATQARSKTKQKQKMRYDWYLSRQWGWF